jgi:hypothetical protein
VAGFDPLKLDSFASLNRTRLAAVAAIEPALRGRQAVELLSAGALRRAIGVEAGRLGLETALAAGDDLLPAFDRCLAAADEGVRAAAVELAVRFGTHLGYLLVSLAGEPSTAGVEGEMSVAYRAQWSRVRHVVLGGGVVSGNLGRVMREVAREMVRTVVAPGFRLDVHDYARELGLIGAALGVQDVSATSALLYDFGGSWVKLGYAYYEDGALASLRLLPALTVESEMRPEDRREESVRALGEAMSRRVAAGWREGQESGLALGREVVCAVNGYVDAELPTDVYSAVRALDGSADWLSEAVSKQAGERIEVKLVHDGTAAARVLAGERDAAVIMLGTWLGVGLAPPADAVLRLSPGFVVERR